MKNKNPYKNIGLLKKRRLEKLELKKSTCEVCGRFGNIAHHKDRSKDNHSLKNLQILCDICHRWIHRNDERKKVSKYIKLYGMTLEEMAQKWGGSASMYSTLHHNGELRKFISDDGKTFYKEKEEKAKIKKARKDINQKIYTLNLDEDVFSAYSDICHFLNIPMCKILRQAICRTIKKHSDKILIRK